MKLSIIRNDRTILASAFILSALFLLPHSLWADGVAGPPRLGQDATTRLQATLTSLDNVKIYLQAVPSAGFGGYIELANADLTHALADLDAASAYVMAHPEANRLLAPIAAITDSPVSIGQSGRVGARGNPTGPQYLNTALNQLSLALRNVANTPQGQVGSAPSYLGDLGGNRVKIIVSLVKVNADLMGAVNFYNSPLLVPSAAAAVALGKYQGQVTLELADTDGPTVIEIPKSLLDGTAPAGTPAATPTAALMDNSSADQSGGQQTYAIDDLDANPDALANTGTLPEHLALPSVFASVALSGAISLGGLYFFSRRKHLGVAVPIAASLLVGALVFGLSISYGDIAPPPPPPPPPADPLPSPRANQARGATQARGVANAARGARARGVAAIVSTPPPHVTGNATVYVVGTGDSVHVILTRKNVADLLGQPPAR